jgi:hypothetical protein
MVNKLIGLFILSILCLGFSPLCFASDGNNEGVLSTKNADINLSPDLKKVLNSKYNKMNHTVSSTYPVEYSNYDWRCDQFWDHDELKLVKVEVLVDNMWFNYANFSVKYGYYYKQYTFKYPKIAEGIRVTTTLGQNGYFWSSYKHTTTDYKIEKNPIEPAYPNTPNLASNFHVKDYNWFTGLPKGASFEWVNY